jgi:hypothetical protein
MADGLFGTPTGFRTYDRDQADLALLASQARHQDALSGLNRAQAEALLRNQASEEAKAKSLAAIAGGRGGATLEGGIAPTFDALVDAGKRVSSALFSVGDVTGAQKAANEAALTMSRVATGEAAKAREVVSQGQATLQKIDRLQALLTGVNGPDSHAAFLMAAKADPLLGQDRLPEELRTYNPAVIRRYIAGSDALKRQVEMEDSKARTSAYVATQASARGRHAVLNEQGERTLTLAQQRETRLAKAGGTPDKPVGPPSTAAVKAMRADLEAQGLLLTDEAAGEAQSLELAERAKRLVASTGGALTETEARARVIDEAREAGEILPPEEGGLFPPRRAKPGAFSPQIGSLTRPRTLTPGGTARIGEYVRDPASGQVMQATKGGWKPIGRAALANPLAEDFDEEEVE